MYSWMRLTCTTNIASGGSVDAEAASDQIDDVTLVRLLDGAQPVEEVLVVGEGGRAGSSCDEVAIDPGRADARGDEARQARVGVQQPAARRDAVGLVVEPLGPQLVEVGQQVRLEQIGVQLRHAVDAVASRPSPGGPCAPAWRRPSSMIDMRAGASSSPGQRVCTWRRKRWLIS